MIDYAHQATTAALENTGKHSTWLYRSCIALFYRKRLPQQQGDRRMRERDTSMH